MTGQEIVHLFIASHLHRLDFPLRPGIHLNRAYKTQMHLQNQRKTTQRLPNRDVAQNTPNK